MIIYIKLPGKSNFRLREKFVHGDPNGLQILRTPEDEMKGHMNKLMRNKMYFISFSHSTPVLPEITNQFPF